MYILPVSVMLLYVLLYCNNRKKYAQGLHFVVFFHDDVI